jgi:hypothetical protein
MTLSLNLEATAPSNALDDLTAELEAFFEKKKEAERLAKEVKKADEALRAKLEAAGLLNEDFQGLGFVHASVSRTKRFDEAQARDVLTPAEQRKCEKKVLDSALAKALFPEKYELCQKDQGSWTMRLSLDV